MAERIVFEYKGTSIINEGIIVRENDNLLKVDIYEYIDPEWFKKSDINILLREKADENDSKMSYDQMRYYMRHYRNGLLVFGFYSIIITIIVGLCMMGVI